MHYHLNVLIATYRRPHLLRDALRSIAVARESGDVQVVVADNADDAATRRVCREALGLDVRHLPVSRPGKNAALNRALQVADGDLLLFTDDDVVVESGWLESMRRAAEAWPGHDIFGGRILPAWPQARPRELMGSRYLGVCFSALDPSLPEAPSDGFVPFGPNMGVRRRVFAGGHRYNEAIGPKRSSYVMGSETEFVRRVTALGAPAVFVPSSTVHHRIGARELRRRALLRRGIRYGRQIAYQDQVNATFGTPALPAFRAHYLREAAGHAASAVGRMIRREGGPAFERAMDAAVAVGAFRQWLTQPAPPHPPEPVTRDHPALHRSWNP